MFSIVFDQKLNTTRAEIAYAVEENDGVGECWQC